MPAPSGSLTQLPQLQLQLGKNIAIKKINSDLEYNGYSLTNTHSGFVNQEALL